MSLDENYYDASFTQMKQGVRSLLDQLKHKHPNAVAEIAICEQAVKDFCDFQPTKDINGLMTLSQKQTNVIAVITTTQNSLRRQAMWDRT
jgi:hypothetical protein